MSLPVRGVAREDRHRAVGLQHHPDGREVAVERRMASARVLHADGKSDTFELTGVRSTIRPPDPLGSRTNAFVDAGAVDVLTKRRSHRALRALDAVAEPDLDGVETEFLRGHVNERLLGEDRLRNAETPHRTGRPGVGVHGEAVALYIRDPIRQHSDLGPDPHDLVTPGGHGASIDDDLLAVPEDRSLLVDRHFGVTHLIRARGTDTKHVCSREHAVHRSP